MKIEKIKTGDVLFVHGQSDLADIIEGFQEIENNQYGKWTHAGLFLIIEENLYVCEADKLGICLTPFKAYTDAKKELMIGTYIPHDTSIFADDFIDFSLPYCGHAKYNKWGLIQQAWKYLKKLINKNAKIYPKPNNTKFMCGEWVAYVYNNLFGEFCGWASFAPLDLILSEKYTLDKYEYV
jgi:hypothetical protein